MAPLSTSGGAPVLADCLRAVAPVLPSQLVAPACAQEIERLASALPVVDMAGFERHLGGGRTDFALRVARGEPGIERWFALARQHPGSSFHRVAACIRRPSVLDVWLEFDVDGGRGRDPSIFCGFVDARPETAAEALRPLGATPRALRTLERIHQALPAGARMFQVGLMLARPDRGLRALVRHVDHDGVAALLRAMDWCGDAEAIAAAVESWGGLTDNVFLSLDLDDAIGPRIGLELMFADGSAAGYDPRWDRLLSRFVVDGLCTDAERDALLSWPGHVTAPRAGARWPCHLSADTVLTRLDNHVKVVLERGRVSAKAYFGFQTTRPGPREH